MCLWEPKYLSRLSNLAAICVFGVVIWGVGVVFGRNFDLGQIEIARDAMIWAEILNFAGEILILDRIWPQFLSLGAEI
jgi:hypothetical protein